MNTDKRRWIKIFYWIATIAHSWLYCRLGWGHETQQAQETCVGFRYRLYL